MSPQREGGTDTQSADASDPWTPDAIAEKGGPTIGKSVGEMREGAVKFADGATDLVLALIITLAILFNRKDIEAEDADSVGGRIDRRDPFWSMDPIPEDEWDENTRDVSEDTGAYLYGPSKTE